MKILLFVISLLLLITQALSPIFLFKKLGSTKFKILKYFGLGILITLTVLTIIGWWSNKSTEILLSHYGFNFDAMDLQERYANVAGENLQEVKNLEISNNGIGWPAKVMVMYPFFLVYLLLVYLFMTLTKKRK